MSRRTATTSQPSVETFVVQIWTSADETEASHSDLRGFVEHVGSGRRKAFRNAADFVAFFQSQAQHPTTGWSQSDEVVGVTMQLCREEQ